MSRQSFIMLTGAIDGSLIVSFSLTMHIPATMHAFVAKDAIDSFARS